MTALLDDQVRELKQLFPKASAATEANLTYILIPALLMPDGCTPVSVDVLLCPSPQGGYNSKLYFAERVTSKTGLNWHLSNVRILERNWHAFSWRTPAGLRLAQMVAAHLKALR